MISHLQTSGVSVSLMFFINKLKLHEYNQNNPSAMNFFKSTSGGGTGSGVNK